MAEPTSDQQRSLIDDIISEPVVISVIVLNAVTAVYFYAFPDLHSETATWIGWIDVACIAFFVLEVCLKITRLGWREYFGSNWNKFDFAVTAASAPILIAPLLGVSPDLFGKIAIIRILRLLRLMRALRVGAATSLMHFLKKPVFNLLLFLLLFEFIGDMDVEHEAKGWILEGLEFAMIMCAAWAVERLYVAVDENIFVPKSTSGDWPIDTTLLTFLRIFVRLAVLFAGLIIALDAIGEDPFHLLAGLGIGGMALAFAARDLVANIIGGILVFINRPFRMGDHIKVSGIDGWVTGMRLRETEVTAFYGEKFFIPNKTFTEGSVENIDARQSYMTHKVLKLHHETKADQVSLALEILGQIALDDDLVSDTHWVCFDNIEQDGLKISLWYAIERWTPADQESLGGEYHKIFLVESRVNLEIMKRFEAAGLRLALPIEVRSSDGGPGNGLYGGPPAA